MRALDESFGKMYRARLDAVEHVREAVHVAALAGDGQVLELDAAPARRLSPDATAASLIE